MEDVPMQDPPASATTDAGSASAAAAAPEARKRGPPKVKPTGPGYCVLPASRITKIVKSDKDITLLTKEAIFLISVATELFIKKLSEAAYTEALMHKRRGIQYKDLATAIQTNDIFFYLSEVLPLPVPLAAALATRQKKLKRDEGMPDDDEPEPAAPLPPPPSLPKSTPAPATSTAPQAQSPATPHNPRLVDLMNPAPGSNGTQVAEGDERQMTLDTEP